MMQATQTTQISQVSTSFKFIAILAIIWNLMGVFAYLGEAMMTPEMLETLPENQQAAYRDMPPWVTTAFAMAVFGGFIGSLLLLMRKHLAQLFLILSLIGVLANDLYTFVLSDSFEFNGSNPLWLQLFVLLVAVYLLVLFYRAKARGWIN